MLTTSIVPLLIIHLAFVYNIPIQGTTTSLCSLLLRRVRCITQEIWRQLTSCFTLQTGSITGSLTFSKDSISHISNTDSHVDMTSLRYTYSNPVSSSYRGHPTEYCDIRKDEPHENGNQQVKIMKNVNNIYL